MKIKFKTYRIFWGILFFCMLNITIHAQQSTSAPGYALADVEAFYRQLKIAAQDLKSNHTLQAVNRVLSAESLLKNMQGERNPTLCADLALAFAKVNLSDKAKIYQALAMAKPRGNVATIPLPTVETLAESFVLLADKPGLAEMFEKVIATVPKPQRSNYQVSYVANLIRVSDHTKAAEVLADLYSDVPLRAEERAKILSLLIINSLKLNQTGRLTQYFQELNTIKSPPSAYSLLARGMYHQYKNDLTNAKHNFEALAIEFDKGKRTFGYIEGVLQLANLLSITAKKDSAAYYFRKVGQELKQPIESTALGINYLKLLQAHQLRFNQASNIKIDLAKDSVYQRELITATRELNYQHKIEQDKQKALLAKKQRDVEQLVLEKKRQQLGWTIASLILLSSIGAIIIYFLNQRKQQNKLLHLAEVERLKQQHKADLIKKLSDSQEAERWRIADQLHDEVGSMISVVRLNLSEHPLKNEAITTEKLETANRILADVADTVREMSHQLMPVAIRQYGLIQAIEQLIADINTSGKLYIEHLIHGFEDVSKYPEDFQISFYRIVQELFQNIVKHAKATNAIFQLVEHPDSINLYIEDNGRGIVESEKDKTGKGIGLLTNRIDYFEGKISIEGAPGKGTLILIDIPTGHMMSEKLKAES